jgi:hypothetical protein
MNSSDSSSSEFNFNNNNNSSNKKPASLNKTKHSISMFQIQQLLEIRTDQKLIDNEEDSISSLTTTTTTTSSKRTFVRNTAGSFDLNVNNLNLNESSKSNSKLIIDLQQQQQQNDFNKLPVDSAQALACSALNTNCLLGRAATTPVRSRSPNLRSNSSLNVLPVSNNNINKSSNQSETDYFKNNEIKSNSKLFTSSASESALKHQDKSNLYNEIQNTTIYNEEQEQNEQFKPINVIKSLDLNHVISLTDLNLLATNDNKKTFNSLDLTDEFYENNNNNNSNKEYDSNKNAKIKKQKKSSAFAWMGRTVGKKINNKHQNFNSHHHHHVRKLTSSPNTTITTTTTDSNHPSSSSSLNIKSDNISNNNNDSILIATTSNASESMASANVLSTPTTTTTTNTSTNISNSTNTNKSNKKLIRIDWTVKFILVK